MTKADEILKFWFHDVDASLRFAKNAELDQKIRNRFAQTYEDIVAGKTEDWRKTPEGRLAEIVVLDQFSRNMFRDSPKAFAADSLALKLAMEAVAVGDDIKVPVEKRAFFYLPYMHSEDPQIHEKAMKLFAQAGLESNFKFEVLHKNIIDRFGRYPHRNEVLGRVSTPEEIEFLKGKGSSF